VSGRGLATALNLGNPTVSQMSRPFSTAPASDRAATAIPPHKGHSRSLWQRGWARFDGLSNLQTVGFVSALVLGMVATAAFLLVASVPRLAGNPTPAIGVNPALGRPTLAPAAARSAIPPVGAVPPVDPLLPSHRPSPATTQQAVQAVSLAVNLRAEPRMTSRLLTTLPAASELWLVGESAREGDATWQHVRTMDGREGWIIASALD
jgi:hypothetical protein